MIPIQETNNTSSQALNKNSPVKKRAEERSEERRPGANVALMRLFALRAFVLSSFVIYLMLFSFTASAYLTLGAIILSTAMFTALSFRLVSKSGRSSAGMYGVQLIWDSLVILLFVWLTGGATNPFIYYQLLIIAVSASILPERYAWLFAALGIVAYSGLIYGGMGMHASHMDASFKSHLMGMWINFTGSALLIAFFISRLTSALRRQESALQLAREENLKNEQIIGIGTLAASTVHSFGTPLSTITMAASEIEALHQDDDTRECVAVIKAQIDRCKHTMRKLTALTTRKRMDKQRIPLADLINEIKEYLVLVNASPMPGIHIEKAFLKLELPGGILLLHALINLIDNAVCAAESYVSISAALCEKSNRFHFIIEDDGGGMQSDSNQRKAPGGEARGLGIGLLLVNATIERLAGSVSYQNSTEQNRHTRITVALPVFHSRLEESER